MMGGGGGGGQMGGGNLYQAIATAAVKGATTSLKLKALKQSLEQQADIAGENATLADIQARDAIDDGRNSVTDYQRNLSGFKSSQINALAENGIDVTQGSAIDILASTEMMAQNDIDTLKYNATMKSWGHRVQETNFINQKNSLLAQAKSVRPRLNAELAAIDQFASSMMGGGGGSPMQGGESLTMTQPVNGSYNANSNFSMSLYGKEQGASWQNYNWNWMGAA
ncbi:hypothetical protein J9864_003472 [Acinetobacter baumannii]|nr:hypothetical protein [Acinetobacter baumannii]EKV0699596.1 hypothetical protein [Acinetobacter baumannii]EKX7316252.1 hypothetical protein [Acinetobacter baumannii]EKY0971965.1 hypothetical protein [Acinetobacter baumannii]ELB1157845.1 hypothetical protein [Acinetobacter baumannii]